MLEKIKTVFKKVVGFLRRGVEKLTEKKIVKNVLMTAAGFGSGFIAKRFFFGTTGSVKWLLRGTNVSIPMRICVFVCCAGLSHVFGQFSEHATGKWYDDTLSETHKILTLLEEL